MQKVKRKCSQRSQFNPPIKQEGKCDLDQIFLTSQKQSISYLKQESNCSPAFNILCQKLERLIEKQNISIVPPKISHQFLDKFDKLLEFTSKIYDSLQKVLQRVQRLQSDKKPCNFSLIEEPIGNPNRNQFEGSFCKLIVHKVEEDNGQERNNSMVLQQEIEIDSQPSSPLRNKLSFQSKVEQQQIALPKSLLDLTQILLLSETQSDVLSVLSKSVGSFFNKSALYYFTQFNIGRLSYLDMKIRFSQDIVHNLINLAQQWFCLYKKIPDQKRKLIVNKKGCVYKLHGIASLQSLRFLIAKYPPNRRKKIDSELSQRIQQMDISSKVQYEMLRNAKMEIGLEPGQTDFGKDIKKWLNKLIIESKRQYPSFKQIMKEIFLGRQSSIDGEGKMDGVQYLINVKIPEQVQLYTPQEIEAPGLQIKNPALLRILMKWCEELISYFTNSKSKITSNQFGFKPVTPQIPAIKIPYSRMQQLAEKLRHIEQSYLSIRKAQQIENIGVLINDLITLSLDGVKGYQFLDSTQITIIKLSEYLSESLKSYLFIFLNMVLAKLVDVRGQYPFPRSQASIQLINFNVMDLLRCKCSGTKPQIYRIYNDILKHNDYFQIIRVKNKLNESTRDILINLKLKHSFLICQVQLSLGQSPQQINSQFCHYLYELQRSSFGIVFQCASQICNLDPRIEYVKKQKNLVFKKDHSKKMLINKVLSIKNQDNNIYCSFEHLQTKMQKIQNRRPYCCRYCTSFIPAYRICLQYFRCPICFLAICPKCVILIAGENNRFINRYISSKANISQIEKFIEVSDICSGIWSMESLSINVMNVLDKYQYLIHILINNMGCKYNIYKKYKDSYTEVFCTLPQISEEIEIISQPCFHTLQPLKKIQVKSLLSLQQYRKIHLKLSWTQLQQILKQNDADSVLCILDQELKTVMIVDIIESEQKIQSYKLSKECHQVVKQYNKSKQNAQIELTSKKITDIDFLKEIEDPQSVVTLNLWENQIQDISPLRKFKKVKQLYLRQNNIDSIEPILGMHDLQIASLSHNNLRGALPVLKMPYLSYLLINDTNIDCISNINKSNLEKLATLRAENMAIRQLPQFKSLKNLKIIKVDNCKIQSLQQFCQSNLPLLQRVYIQHNSISGSLPQFNFGQLKLLKLGYNSITSINQFSLSTCPHLQKIFFGNNKISGTLRKFNIPSLNRINLQNNQIEELDDMDSVDYPLLQILDLQNNLIKGLKSMKLKSLTKLHLFNNKIKNIDNFQHVKLPCLQELDLSHNQIEGALPLIKFYSLKSLNLSDNKITDINKLGTLKLPKVNLIKLNNNIIQSPIPILDLQRLCTLDLSNNKIKQEKFIDHIYLIPLINKIILKGNPQELKNAIMQKVKMDLLEKLEL